jgi:hypothetical protein
MRSPKISSASSPKFLALPSPKLSSLRENFFLDDDDYRPADKVAVFARHSTWHATTLKSCIRYLQVWRAPLLHSL